MAPHEWPTRTGRHPPQVWMTRLLEIRDMRGDGERAASAPSLKRLQHMPLLAQFARDWRNVSGGCRPAVQRDHEARADVPVLTHDKVGHGAAFPCG